jgi:hypothetical protein
MPLVCCAPFPHITAACATFYYLLILRFTFFTSRKLHHTAASLPPCRVQRLCIRQAEVSVSGVRRAHRGAPAAGPHGAAQSGGSVGSAFVQM